VTVKVTSELQVTVTVHKIVLVHFEQHQNGALEALQTRPLIRTLVVVLVGR
jgi:hypothetical protein